MKKRNIFAISIAAIVLVSTLVLGCVFAFGSDTPDDKINLMVKTTGNTVVAGNTFDVEVYIANDDISNFNIAGLQVNFTYDNAKMTATKLAYNLPDSTVEYKTADGEVIFVCVKNELDGYKTLNSLFTVTFEATSEIKNPSALFSSENITFLAGDTDALKLKSESTYAGNIPAIAKAIIDSELKIATSEKTGAVVVVPSGKTKAEIENEGVTVELKEGDKVGTGSTIQVGDETAQVVVKGDVDGNGVIDIFDAMLIKKAIDNKDNADENFTNREIYELAADIVEDGTVKTDDVQSILNYILGK